MKGIGTFDYKDLFGLLIGAGITIIVIRNRTKNLTKEKRKLSYEIEYKD